MVVASTAIIDFLGHWSFATRQIPLMPAICIITNYIIINVVIQHQTLLWFTHNIIIYCSSMEVCEINRRA